MLKQIHNTKNLFLEKLSGAAYLRIACMIKYREADQVIPICSRVRVNQLLHETQYQLIFTPDTLKNQHTHAKQYILISTRKMRTKDEQAG